MANNFNFKSNIKNLQTKLISQNIRESSNLDILRSEEAIREVIKSHMDRFSATGGLLFDVSKYIARSKEPIKSDYFNHIFEDIYVDLSALYHDLGIVDDVLNLNLQRNKNFFLVIKKRIKDLWNKLSLSRLYIYDDNPSDESYYESFFSDIDVHNIQNITVDKKNGILHLAPVNKKINNLSHLIKNITSTTYPVNSNNGGANHITHDLNTFEYNYKSGRPRDMLRNGLWKESIVCSEVPNIIYNISSDSVPIWRNYKGIVSIIDIEFSYPVDINRFDFDLYGDKSTLIDAVLYKSTNDCEWSSANFLLDDPLEISDPTTITKKYSVRGKAFDIASFYNIEKIKAKHLRLVFNQENYDFLESKDFGEMDIDTKIQNDLSQRRYDIIKFDQNYEESLSTPVNDDNTSLYNKIISVIESVTTIEDILKQIEKIIIPSTDVVTYDFTRSPIFEIGAWSIEPIIETYHRQNGIFESKKYKLKDSALSSVSLKTKQSIPESSTCNWYIKLGDNQEIPIIENDSIIRKEPARPIDMSTYGNLSSWSPGTFILLDFPIDVCYTDFLGIYINGKYNSVSQNQIAYLNSRLLYIHNLTDPYRSKFVIRYHSAMYKSVNLYVLSPKPNTNPTSDIIPFGVVSSRREVLNAFIKNVRFRSSENHQYKYLDDYYTVISAMSTIEESKIWFGPHFNNCVYIADEVFSFFNNSDLSMFNNVINRNPSKLGSNQENINLYFNGQGYGYSDLNILGLVSNIAPLGFYRG